MNKRLFAVLALVSAVSLIGQLLLYPSLPPTVPLHWDIHGQIDAWGPRWQSAFMAALPLGCALLLYFLPSIDPRRRNYPRHSRAYGAVCIVLVGALLAITWAITLHMLGLRLPLSSIIMGLVGVVLIVMGNYMPQLRPNYFVGIKTPWTIENERVWRKTHRMSGILFCIAGAVVLLSAFIPPFVAAWVQGATLAVVVIIPIVYSYTTYRKYKKQEEQHAED